MSDQLQDGRRKGWWWASDVIWEVPGIGRNDLLVYLFLCRSVNRQATCFPSRKTIAAACRMSVDTIDRALNCLENAGLIKKETRFDDEGRQTSNLYTIFDPVISSDNNTRETIEAVLSGGPQPPPSGAANFPKGGRKKTPGGPQISPGGAAKNTLGGPQISPGGEPQKPGTKDYSTIKDYANEGFVTAKRTISDRVTVSGSIDTDTIPTSDDTLNDSLYTDDDIVSTPSKGSTLRYTKRLLDTRGRPHLFVKTTEVAEEAAESKVVSLGASPREEELAPSGKTAKETGTSTKEEMAVSISEVHTTGKSSSTRERGYSSGGDKAFDMDAAVLPEGETDKYSDLNPVAVETVAQSNGKATLVEKTADTKGNPAGDISSGGTAVKGETSEEAPTNRDLIAELARRLHEIPGVEKLKGHYPMIGKAYNQYGYQAVTEAIDDLALEIAGMRDMGMFEGTVPEKELVRLFFARCKWNYRPPRQEEKPRPKEKMTREKALAMGCVYDPQSNRIIVTPEARENLRRARAVGEI